MLWCCAAGADPVPVIDQAEDIGFEPYSSLESTNVQEAIQELLDESGGGAPTDADYLVGTANGTLTNEIVVGTTPQGELGGTWGSPTLDDGALDDQYLVNDADDTTTGDITATGFKDTLMDADEDTKIDCDYTGGDGDDIGIYTGGTLNTYFSSSGQLSIGSTMPPSRFYIEDIDASIANSSKRVGYAISDWTYGQAMTYGPLEAWNMQMTVTDGGYNNTYTTNPNTAAKFAAALSGSGTTSQFHTGYFVMDINSSVTLTDGHGLTSYLDNGGTITNYKSLYLKTHFGNAPTNYWGIYQEDTDATNFFEGGIQLDSDSNKIELGEDQDAEIYHDGSDFYITATTGELKFTDTVTAEKTLAELAAGGGSGDKIEEGDSNVEVIDTGTGQVDIDIDGANNFRFAEDDFKILTDGGEIQFGAGTDATIKHNGTNMVITNNTGNVGIAGSNLVFGAGYELQVSGDGEYAFSYAGTDYGLKFGTAAPLGFQWQNATPATVYSIGITGETYALEKASASADVATFGQWWVRNDTPNTAMFTDDAGNDHVLEPRFHHTWRIAEGKLPTSAEPAIEYNNNRERMRFDASTDESAQFETMLYPYGGGDLNVMLPYSMGSATTNEVIMCAQVMCIGDGDAADVDTDSFDTAVCSSATTVPGTAGYPDYITLDMTGNQDSSAENDILIIKVYRDADAAGDDATGDLELRKVMVYEDR